MDKFSDKIVLKYGNALFMLGDKSDETEFSWRNDIDGTLGGDVTTLYLRPSKEYQSGGRIDEDYLDDWWRSLDGMLQETLTNTDDIDSALNAWDTYDHNTKLEIYESRSLYTDYAKGGDVHKDCGCGGGSEYSTGGGVDHECKCDEGGVYNNPFLKSIFGI